MGLIKEPKNVDLVIQSKPWTKKELAELSKIIKEAKQTKRKSRVSKKTSKNKVH